MLQLAKLALTLCRIVGLCTCTRSAPHTAFPLREESIGQSGPTLGLQHPRDGPGALGEGHGLGAGDTMRQPPEDCVYVHRPINILTVCPARLTSLHHAELV